VDDQQEISAEDVGTLDLTPTITRAEAEKEVRIIQRRCRGLVVLDEATRARLWHTFTAAEDAKDLATAEEVLRNTEVEVKQVSGSSLLIIPQATGDVWQDLHVRFLNAVFAHGDTVGKGCGADFNDIICGGPFDGKQHEYTCPKCGQVGMYGAPLFNVGETA